MKNRILYFTTVLLSLVLVLNSCDTDEGLPFPELLVEPASELLEFSGPGTEIYTFTVKTNQATWEVRSSQDWCVVTPDYDRNTFTVTAKESRSVSAQEATVSVIVDKYDHATVTLRATQEGVIYMDDNTVASTGFGGGTGTFLSPYLITTAGELKKFVEDTNNGNNFEETYFLLERDIVVRTTDWTPIGTGPNTFNGEFDGGEHTLNGILTSSHHNVFGFFGNTNSTGGITGLTITADVENNYNGPDDCFTGAFAGISENTAFFYCSFSGSITGGSTTAGNSRTGGLAGLMRLAWVEECGTAEGSSVKGGITAVNDMTGGIAGEIDEYSKINFSINNATVTGAKGVSGYSAVGGIAGSAIGEAAMEDNINNGITQAPQTNQGSIYYRGGIAGFNNGGHVYDCNTNNSSGNMVGYGDVVEECPDNNHGHEHSSATYRLQAAKKYSGLQSY